MKINKKSSVFILLFATSSLALFLMFQNMTSMQTYVDVSQGNTSFPLTYVRCKTGTLAETDEGVPCQYQYSGHRARDQRLIDLKRLGHKESGLFKGKVHTVKNATELNALSNKVRPGDQIVLLNPQHPSQWHNSMINFEGYGTKTQPILIRAESKAILTGLSSFTIQGHHIFAQHIKMKDVLARPYNNAAFRIGASKRCNYCVVTDLKIDNFNALPAQRKDFRYTFVNVVGKDITLAYSSLTNHLGRGPMVGVRHVPKDAPLRFHLLKNYFAHRPKVDIPGHTNGYEILLFGGNLLQEHRSFSLIENNYIYRADGENEIMTIKMKDVIIRNNTFRNSLGSLSLRSSSRVLVEGNFFIGSNRAQEGGVRITGGGHLVVNNHFENIETPIFLKAGSLEEAKNGVVAYARVKNTIIAHNTIVNCQKGVNLEEGYSQSYDMLPQDVLFANNLFSGMSEGKAFRTANPETLNGIFFRENVFLRQNDPALRSFAEVTRPQTRIKASEMKSFTLRTDLNGLPIKKSTMNAGNHSYPHSESALRVPFQNVSQVMALKP